MTSGEGLSRPTGIEWQFEPNQLVAKSAPLTVEFIIDDRGELVADAVHGAPAAITADEVMAIALEATHAAKRALQKS
jgi:hypothetical protein